MQWTNYETEVVPLVDIDFELSGRYKEIFKKGAALKDI